MGKATCTCFERRSNSQICCCNQGKTWYDCEVCRDLNLQLAMSSWETKSREEIK